MIPSLSQTLVGECEEGHRGHRRGSSFGGRRGWLKEVEFEVPASQDTQSKLRTTEMEHLFNCQYNDDN